MTPKEPQHIVLVEPEIPQNTGNIARLCAATCSHLHLVEPLGFSLADKYLRRAGLDYWPYLNLSLHKNWTECLDSLTDIGLWSKEAKSVAFLSVHAAVDLWQMPKTKVLVFGKETKGLPKHLHEDYSDAFFRIPMYHTKVRSLNLANSVGIALYHQLALHNVAN